MHVCFEGTVKVVRTGHVCLQERMQGMGKNLDELSSLVGRLRLEKRELEQRARILESSLAANTHHEERLHCDEVGLVTA